MVIGEGGAVNYVVVLGIQIYIRHPVRVVVEKIAVGNAYLAGGEDSTAAG